MELKDLLTEVDKYIEDPAVGLPEEVFLFLTENTPMVNVDLIIRDEMGRILLSWRDDEFCGTGWHVPGGVVRLKETFEERIQKTAMKEIGSEVSFESEPVEVRSIIHKEKKTRGHFVAFTYECRLPSGFQINQKGRNPGDVGYLQWHDVFPENMIEVHGYYRKYFKAEKE